MVTVKVESLSCMRCVRNIEQALKDADSNATVQGNLKLSTVSVETFLPQDKILEVIKSVGYSGTVVG